MGFICAVAECKNTKKAKLERGKDLVYHRFPITKPELCKVWVTKCHRRDKFNPKNSTICSDHFTTEDYEDDMMNRILDLPQRMKLKTDAIPSVFPCRGRHCTETSDKENLNSCCNRAQRHHSRNQRLQVNQILEEHNLNTTEREVEVLEAENHPEHMDTRSKELEEALAATRDENLHQRMEILLLKSWNARLNRQVTIQNSKLRRKRLYMDQLTKLKTVFSSSQQKRLITRKRTNWTRLDIVRALVLRSISLKAYETAATITKIPMPATKTLQSWTRTFTCKKGVLKDVLCVMLEMSKTMEVFNRICVISFDEMSLDAQYVQDPASDEIVSNSKVQVIMARGICENWKQPIYYNFDTDVTRSILFEVITGLESAQFPVHGIVSDLVTTNRGLWKELSICENQTSFPNPVETNRNVYVFADVPHCLKNLRNHLLDQPMFYSDGNVVTKDMLEQLVLSSGTELKLCPKLTHHHLEVEGSERMRVRPAAQLLSGHSGVLAKLVFPNKPFISHFFHTVNNGFDVLNSRIPFDQRNPQKSALGTDLVRQLEYLEQLKFLIANIRFMRTKSKKMCVSPCILPFQLGFLISITSVVKLFQELKKLYNLKYLLTCRLNQDVLENFFSVVRSFSKTNSNPTSVEFKYRLRLILLGSKLRPPRGTNVEFAEDSISYLSAQLMKLNKIKPEIPPALEDDPTLEEENTPRELNYYEKESLRYLAGYVAWKLKRKSKTNYGTPTGRAEKSQLTTGWIESISRGGLLIPNNVITTTVELCEQVFQQWIERLSKKPYLSVCLKRKILQKDPSIDPDIIREYLRTRIKIRVRALNNARKDQQLKAKKKKQIMNSYKLKC